jgi:GNAT superfamily N-acetyltransferase
MPHTFRIQRISLPVAGLELLRDEARQGGFCFVDRLIRDWETGTNRFSAHGEQLAGVFKDTVLLAVGGTNRDPYADSIAIGRLRHLYVLARYRRSGIGRALVQHLLADAGGTFRTIRLRTDSKEADAFYRRCGFLPCRASNSTHEIVI